MTTHLNAAYHHEIQTAELSPLEPRNVGFPRRHLSPKYLIVSKGRQINHWRLVSIEPAVPCTKWRGTGHPPPAWFISVTAEYICASHVFFSSLVLPSCWLVAATRPGTLMKPFAVRSCARVGFPRTDVQYNLSDLICAMFNGAWKGKRKRKKVA